MAVGALNLAAKMAAMYCAQALDDLRHCGRLRVYYTSYCQKEEEHEKHKFIT